MASAQAIIAFFAPKNGAFNAISFFFVRLKKEFQKDIHTTFLYFFNVAQTKLRFCMQFCGRSPRGERG